MTCVLVLLMAIDVVVLLRGVPLPLLLYPREEVTRKVTESVTT
jgi:hypothetical protein